MPIITPGGAMTIVAHQDDDILFMNPDIADGIAAGTPTTTVFVTAGDAGLGEAYWMGREDGAMAAYSVMTGSDQWVDETLSHDINGTTFDIASSYLADQPDVRLYFLRLPDGGGVLADDEVEQLARLESGALDSVTSMDGQTYGREDLVDVLTALMDEHAPADFRLQLSEGPHAGGEHTDHIHTTEFTQEALAAHSGLNYTVTHYVQYQSDDLPPNLPPEDAGFALEVMEAYAAHDPAVLDGSGQLAQVYVDWTQAQYIDSSYEVVDGVGGPGAPVDPGGPGPDPDPDPAPDPDPGEGGATYALSGPDAFLFTLDPATGAVSPQDWFSPSLDDAWDQNEDHIYELTLTTDAGDGSAPVDTALWYETTAEGVLTALGDTPDDTPGDGGGDTADPTTPDDPPDTPPDAPTADGTLYSLAGPDAMLFTVDPASGAIAPQDWFSPSLDDAWDQNEDHIYELALIAEPGDGGTATHQSLWFETTADGVLTALDNPPGEDTPGDPGEPGTPGDPTDPTGPSGPTEPPGDGTVYGLGGPDAPLFTIDQTSGAITPQDWFVPSYDDAWDLNEDHIYEVTRLSTPADGGAATREDLRFEVRPDDTLVPLSDPLALMAALFDPSGEAMPAEPGEPEPEELFDGVLV